ncbi:MAG: SRPBCC domain-containing protein [Psychroserpens sp.]|nr:SRPBCC domain-containing protein [Psychroserpens sp.]
MKTTDEPIIVEQVFNKSMNKVWKAITDVEAMRKWFFDNLPDFSPRLGFSTSFEIEFNNKTFTHLWEVVEVIPNKKFVLNWRYEEYPGESYVAFALTEHKKGTKLSVIATIIKDFPEDIEEFSRESGVEGWNHLIKTNLVNYLGD